MFFHVLSFSFIFLNFLSFSLILYHFLSFFHFISFFFHFFIFSSFFHFLKTFFKFFFFFFFFFIFSFFHFYFFSFFSFFHFISFFVVSFFSFKLIIFIFSFFSFFHFPLFPFFFFAFFHFSVFPFFPNFSAALRFRVAALGVGLHSPNNLISDLAGLAGTTREAVSCKLQELSRCSRSSCLHNFSLFQSLRLPCSFFLFVNHFLHFSQPSARYLGVFSGLKKKDAKNNSVLVLSAPTHLCAQIGRKSFG